MRAIGRGRFAAVLLGRVLGLPAAAPAALTRAPGRDDEPDERAVPHATRKRAALRAAPPPLRDERVNDDAEEADDAGRA